MIQSIGILRSKWIRYPLTPKTKCYFDLRPPLVVHRYLLSTRRVKTSTCTPSAPRADTETTSLAWLQLYEQSPISYGIQAFDGYMELVPSKTALPCEKSAIMESALDYVQGVSFQVACRRNMF